MALLAGHSSQSPSTNSMFDGKGSSCKEAIYWSLRVDNAGFDDQDIAKKVADRLTIL